MWLVVHDALWRNWGDGMIIQNVLRIKFIDELLASGISAEQISGLSAIDGDNPVGVKITFADGTDMDLVQRIIDAHDPTPVAPAPTIEEQITANTDYLLDVDFRLILVELGMY